MKHLPSSVRFSSIAFVVLLLLSLGLVKTPNAKAYSCSAESNAGSNCYATAIWGSAIVNGASTHVSVVPQLLQDPYSSDTYPSISDELWVKDTSCAYPYCWIEVGYGTLTFNSGGISNVIFTQYGTFWADRRPTDNSYNLHFLHAFNQLPAVGSLNLDINVENDTSKYMLGVDYLDPNGNYIGSEAPNPESTGNSIRPNYIFIGLRLSGNHAPGVYASGQATAASFINNKYHFSGCPTGFFQGCGQYNSGLTLDNGQTYGIVNHPPSGYWRVNPYYSNQYDNYTGDWQTFCC